MNAKGLLVKLALGAIVAAGLAACNQLPNLTKTLDFGDQILNEAGSVTAKIPGVPLDNEIVQPIPDVEVPIKWVFPQSFPKACNTGANVVQNPKFMLGLANSGFPGNNIPPATVANWQAANGSPQLSPVTGGIGAMGHGNPGYVQMWGFKDGGEAVRQVGLAMTGAYDVYFSVKQFNTATSPVPLRARFVASNGTILNPWNPPVSSAVIDVPAAATGWTMYGPIPLNISGSADTITLASSNLTPYAGPNTTVSWGQYDNVCVLRRDLPEKFDLGIKKDIKTSPLQVGQPNTYTLTVTNFGPGVSSQPIVITDTLLAGLTLTGTPTASPAAAGFTCTTGIVCSSTTPMPAGSSVQITIPVVVNADFQGNIIENCARVTAVGDINPQNDGVCIGTDVIPPAKPINLAIRKQLVNRDGTSVLNAGSTGTYKLDVLNLGGPISSGPVTVVDPMPAGLSLITASITATPSTDWNCAASTSSQLNCTFTGTYVIPAGYVSSLQFAVNVSSHLVGSVKNCAKVIVAGDMVPGNNVSCVKNPVKNKIITDTFHEALSDAITQLETVIEGSADETEAMQRASKGLKDTLKTQVRLMPGTTFEPLASGETNFNAIFAPDGAQPQQIGIGIECHLSYPPLKVGCSIIITN